MCDIRIENISQYLHTCLQQQDASRLRAVAVVSATAMAVGGLSLLRLHFSRKQHRAHSKNHHSDVNCPADQQPKSEQQAPGDGRIPPAGWDADDSDTPLAISKNTLGTKKPDAYIRCHDYLQTCSSSNYLVNQHRATQPAACPRLVNSIDHAILSYLCGSSSDALAKCESTIDNISMGCGSDTSSSTPLALPFLLDLCALIHAQRGDGVRALHSSLHAISHVTKVISTVSAPPTKPALPTLDTEDCLSPAGALSRLQVQRIKFQMTLHLAFIRLTFDTIGSADLAVTACKAIPDHDLLHAISSPIWVKVENSGWCDRPFWLYVSTGCIHPTLARKHCCLHRPHLCTNIHQLLSIVHRVRSGDLMHPFRHPSDLHKPADALIYLTHLFLGVTRRY
eukprot:jgi/Ulvmu1/1674/UM115_0003.1